MDDRNLHEDGEDKDIKNDPVETGQDDEPTPADTEGDDPESEPKKDDSEVVREKQKNAWLDKIKSGKVKLDDMPSNLEWLKKDIQKELGEEPKEDSPRQEPNRDRKYDKAEIREAMAEERAEEDFDVLVDDLREADLSDDQAEVLKDVYGDLVGEFGNKPTPIQKLKALKIARKAAGLQDSTTYLKERRRKGAQLPPLSSRKRSTVSKDKVTEMEKKLSGGLPPGFKA